MKRTYSVGRLFLLAVCIIALSTTTYASHLIGGTMTYKYLGDTTIGGGKHYKYEVTLVLYQDCISGVPEAIREDNPAFFTTYKYGETVPHRVDTNIRYDATPGSGGSIEIPASGILSPCGFIHPRDLPAFCMQRQTFKKTYYLAESASGYVVVYQRCCGPSKTSNISKPGDQGTTLYCIIPAGADSLNNNSAVFGDYPQPFIPINKPTTVDHSAIDADGDSLSYELYHPLNGAANNDIKPRVASPPPYDGLPYFPPYTAQQPIIGSDPIAINPVTGVISVTPSLIGQYLIGVQCTEWRNGKVINTVRRDFTWIVANPNSINNSFQPDAGPDRTVLAGDTLHFNAKGGTRFRWLTEKYLDNPYTNAPIGTFPDAGEYFYVLQSTTDSGCSGTDTLKVSVLPHSDFTAPNAFTPNNDGINDFLKPIARENSTLKIFKVFNRYGNEVFHSTTAALGWDGTYNGVQQATGVYVWMVEYLDETGTTRTSSGSTILLR